MTRMITENIDLNFSHFETIVEAKEYLEKLISKHGNLPIVDESDYDDYDVHCTITREVNAQDILKEDYDLALREVWRKMSILQNKLYGLDNDIGARPLRSDYYNSFRVVHSFISYENGVTSQDIKDVRALYPDKHLQFKYVNKVATMVETGNAPYEIDMQKYEKELAEWLANGSQRVKELYAEFKEVEAELAIVKQEEANLNEAYRKAINGSS